MADVCVQLGAAHEANQDADAALAAYRDGSKHCDTHEPSLVAVARQLMRQGELDAAQQQVSALMTLGGEVHTVARTLRTSDGHARS
jgi:prefoldin subunit 5